jgi:hypothetical protein
MLNPNLYPHIFDAILAHADPRTLLAIECTEKAMRRRVNQHLYRHVMLSLDPPDKQGMQWFMVIRLPCPPWRVLSTIPDDPDGYTSDDRVEFPGYYSELEGTSEV